MTDSIEEMAKLRKSEIWMTEYANQLSNRLYITVEELFKWAEHYLETGDASGYFEGIESDPEFWDHYEAIRGVKAARRGNFFACSNC